MSTVFVPLATGFEEIEAITCIDVLRRADVEVDTIHLGEREVRGAHGIVVEADRHIDSIDAGEAAGIVLPGGMPGATNLRDDRRVVEMVRRLDEEGKLVAAICAAPIVLERAGVLEDRTATSYPGFDQEMPSCSYSEKRVVVDGNLVTARGPGVALEFALLLAEKLAGPDVSRNLEKKMLVSR